MSPLSETRTKISVHMMAQVKPTATNEILSGPAEEVTNLLQELLMQESQGLAINEERLKARLSEVDIYQVNFVMAAVRAYLVDDAQMPSDDAEQFMEKALPAISASLAKVGTTPHLIKDVDAFKASLQMSTEPVIRHLAEFEDTKAKP